MFFLFYEIKVCFTICDILLCNYGLPFRCHKLFIVEKCINLSLNTRFVTGTADDLNPICRVYFACESGAPVDINIRHTFPQAAPSQ